MVLSPPFSLESVNIGLIDRIIKAELPENQYYITSFI